MSFVCCVFVCLLCEMVPNTAPARIKRKPIQTLVISENSERKSQIHQIDTMNMHADISEQSYMPFIDEQKPHKEPFRDQSKKCCAKVKRYAQLNNKRFSQISN